MSDALQLGNQLWSEVDAAVSPYPRGVVAVPRPVKRTAFFPGGLGLWVNGNIRVLPAMPRVLIVGQDFNTLETYDRIQELGTAIGSSPTWRNLLPILSNAGFPAAACVFTNFYMGLRKSGRETGAFPGARDGSFKNRCTSFFIRQVGVWRPKLLITLGLPALRAVTGACDLRGPGRICDCDFIFRNLFIAQRSLTLVALTHPSHYPAHVRRRRYRELMGLESEQAMLADGLAAAELRF